MEFNQYNMYAYAAEQSRSSALDEVDEFRQNLLRMTEYDDVRNFITNKYGEFEGKKWIKYPKLHKKVYLYLDDEKIEFCALKDKKQYWGRRWRLEEVQ